MVADDGIVEIDCLERHLLLDAPPSDGDDADDGRVLYRASFREMEDYFVKYQTIKWVLYSLALIFAWGIGLIMLIYLPIRRYIWREDLKSRQLYVTTDAIVYKVTRPVLVPWFGVLKKEKHVVLSSVADIVVEQGYLQSHFGISSVRIEHIGVRRSTSDDVQIQGITDPRDFRNAVLTHVSSLRSGGSRQSSYNEDRLHFSHFNETPPTWAQHAGTSLTSPLKPPSRYLKHASFHSSELLLQKLEEVESSIKRVETLIEEHKSQISEDIV